MGAPIQIFGTKKCKDTQKALRFFMERRVDIQFIDLTEKAFSKGELESITRNVQPEELIDKDGKRFDNKNMQYMVYDPFEEILNDPLLAKTPVVRLKNKAFAGYDPDGWKTFI
ncbi:MAG: arsenate reductase family protein [Candidatus Kapaibacterium sp.]